MIIKLQRPIVPPDAEWMAYPQSRRQHWLLGACDVPSEVREAMGKDYRGYFEAEETHGGASVAIGKRVPDQGW